MHVLKYMCIHRLHSELMRNERERKHFYGLVALLNTNALLYEPHCCVFWNTHVSNIVMSITLRANLICGCDEWRSAPVRVDETYAVNLQTNLQ
jgi:hypothetical protein